ncbi:MAG: HAD-IA family hydrolase [Bacteroidaceae bacterium]|nr:HAD-IA family hydrolase [Bacteroidaceae bacterium]
MLKAILFDMDGVLFDSMPNHAYAWSHAMTDFGLKMEPEEVYMNEGRTGKGTINILSNRYWGRDATDEEVQQIYDAKSSLFNTLPEAQPMPGAMDLLNKVRAQGLMRVIVTGSATHALLDRVNAAFPGIFSSELMVTAFDVQHGKPHPEPYLMGLKKANISASEAIVVENAPLGIQAARAAGIFTIAVNTGPLPDSVLLDAGANLVMPSMPYLADHWEEIGKLKN